MNTQGLWIGILAVGAALECLASPFTFPETDEEGRSLSTLEYDDYDSKLHHHNGQQNGAHNKRKKFRRKKKRRPCFYKTSDGRTFFWTGVNIHETNIYVNHGGDGHGGPVQGDVGSLGAGPCRPAGGGSEADVQNSPQGSLQLPQRPNRPVLQNLASYIPSGPVAWNWIQGIQWANYLPNQQSFNSAVNTVVDYLPGFGSSRPKPPTIPIKPVTEFPFTRPTDFTRPPTFTRPTLQPVYTRPTQQPVYTRPTQQPVYTRPTQQPVYTRPTQQPVYTRPTQQPVYTRPTQQPVYTRPTQQPIYTRPSSTQPSTSTGEDGSDENYDYSNFSSENSDNSADTGFGGLGGVGNTQSSNQPASNIPTVGSIGNGIKPVYERPGKYFNDYIVKPIRGSISEVVSWF